MNQHTMTDRELAELLAKPIASLGLPVRTVNKLESIEILTVGQLLRTPPWRLRAIQGIHDRTMEEIYRALERWGFMRNAYDPECGSPEPQAAEPRSQEGRGKRTQERPAKGRQVCEDDEIEARRLDVIARRHAERSLDPDDHSSRPFVFGGGVRC